eukprot:CAMPEP_0119132096 /NCGR_PEP_ID=MMETSP1310-20130426/11450_1 /TAXON_ID=464262 /ORGANISM="Genus nov. species nov., Strain RCC2339" /LENGTH=141 /DNA_ID=CAMNT_0007122709 /DNA_START=48 /DNA_END=473 /DNA_ORIENTATION=+
MSQTHQLVRFVGRAARAQPVGGSHQSVTGILCLSGLPRVLLSSVVAHECLHAYMRLRNVSISLDVEEGLAQLMAFLWLEQYRPEGEGRDHEARLSAFHRNLIHEHPSLVYGDGFRAAYAAHHRFGLKPLLDHVAITGLLPE